MVEQVVLTDARRGALVATALIFAAAVLTVAALLCSTGVAEADSWAGLSAGLAGVPAISAPAAVAMPAISAPQDRIVGEADGGLDLDVTLNAPGLSTVTVNYFLGGGSCNHAVQGQTGTLTFAPGETLKTIHAVLNECNAVSDFNAFQLTLTAPTNATIARSQMYGNVVDDDTSVTTPHLEVRGVTVDEKDGQAFVSVMLGGPAGQITGHDVSVDYATSNDTATSGSDYTQRSGTFTFTPGQTVKTIAVPITDDNVDELAERFNVTLSNPSGATISDGTAAVEIGASDGQETASPAISAGQDMIVGEADGYADLPIRLSAPSADPVTVRYTTGGGSCNHASAGRDQTTTTFLPGQTTQTVRVNVNECDAVTAINPFYLTVDTPSPPSTIGRAQMQVNTIDNDTLATTPNLMVRGVTVDEKADLALVSVLLGGTAGQRSGNTVKVDYATSDDSASAGADYTARSGTLTFAPGQNVKTIAVPILDDALAEPAERFKVSLSNATGAAIIDPSDFVEIGASDGPQTVAPAISAGQDMIAGESDGYADLPITLSAPSPNPVTVRYTTGGGSCNHPAPGRDQEVAKFLPGQTTQTVRVDLNECDAVTVFSVVSLALDTPSAPATIAREELMLNVVDDDTPVTTPHLDVRGVTVDEKAGKALVSVMLGGPLGQVSGNTVNVDYATSNGSATAGSDYTARNGTLTFAPGQTVKTIAVPIIDDGSPEPAERFTVSLSNASGATIGAASDSVEIAASDNATVAKPAISAPADQIVSTDDGYADFPVRLSAPSTDAVSVDWGAFSGGCSDIVQRSGTITFLPGETVGVVRLPLTACSTGSFFHPYSLTLSNPSANATIARAVARVGIVGAGVDLSTLAVTPAAPHIAVGANQQFTAAGTLSDALIVDLSTWVTWTSSSTPVATVDASGLAHGVSAGQSTITAALGPPQDPVTGSALLTVDGPVGPAPQTITFDPLPGKTFGDGDFAVSATASSGLAVSFAAAGSCTVTGSNVHITGAGTCTITASQAGNASFSPAPDVARAFTVAKAAQTITFAALTDRTFGDGDFTVSATASSGLAVSFAAAGSCTVAGQTVHITGAGTCTITASQAGDANRSAAPDVARSFQVNKAAQAISFAALADKTFGAADFSVSGTASSGLAVSFAAAGSCTVTGSSVHITGAGACTITASQAGNANFNAAPDVPRAFTVNKAAQTITFAALADKAPGSADFAVSATASSGLAVSFAAAGTCTVTSATVHLTGQGTCTITASQAGNANFSAAPDVARSFQVTQAAQTITFAQLSGRTFGDPDFAVSATATSGLPVSFAAAGSCTVIGVTVHITGAGTCTITASQPGDADHEAAPAVARSFQVAKAAQTLTFAALDGRTFGDADFTVSATASSNLPVSFAATGSCTVTGSSVHITAVGTCTITASQAGDPDHDPATSVARPFTVAKAAQTITFAALPSATFGDADFTVTATASSGLAVSFTAAGTCTVSGGTVHLTAAGTCTVTASQAGNTSYAPAASVARAFQIAQKVQPTDKKRCIVPDVTGRSLANARILIQRSRCRIGTVHHAYSKKIAKGNVISQSPRAQRDVRAGTRVDLTVSKGRRHHHR